jgi:hypothetical protein
MSADSKHTKHATKLLFLALLFVCCFGLDSWVHAQITLDGSLSPGGALTGPNMLNKPKLWNRYAAARLSER